MSKRGFFGHSGRRPVRDLVARGLSGFFANGSAFARPPASLLAAGVLVVALLAGAGTAGAQTAPAFGSASVEYQYTVGETVDQQLPEATGGTQPITSYDLSLTPALPDGLDYTRPSCSESEGFLQCVPPRGGRITGSPTTAESQTCRNLTARDSALSPRTATLSVCITVREAQTQTETPPPAEEPPPTQEPPSPAPEPPSPAPEPESPAVQEEPQTSDLMPEFVPDTFTAQNYEQDVMISPVALPEARGGDAPLRYGLSPALPDGLSFDEETRVVSGAPTETIAATVYTLTATDADGDAATLTFTITVEPGADRTLGEINRAVMPELARAMTSSALDAVAGRIEDATSAAGGSKAAARPAVRRFYGIPAEETYDVPTGLSREAPGDMSFSVSLAGGMDDFPAEAEDVPPGEPGRIAVWAVGDYGRLSGKQRMIGYKGGLFAGHLGTDVRLGPDFIIGVAASWFEGSFDYTDGRSGTAIDGELRSRMTGFYPYMSWSLTEAFSMWAAAGWGFGEIKIEDKDVSGIQKGESIMRTGAAGGKLRLISRAGAFSGGLTTVDLKGEAWLTRLNVEGNDDRIEGVTTDVNRLRLALRGAHELSLQSGSSVTPSLEFGVRRDGGDGETGFGAELGGRLAYFSPALGLTIEMNGRGLLAHEGDNEDWALGGGIRYDRGADRRGLSFSMLPSYGETAGRVEELWERGSADARGGDSSFGLETEVGYGFAAFGGGGLLIPYGGVAPYHGDGRSYRLGSRLEMGSRLDLRLEGERLERDAGWSGHELILSGRMSW